MSEYPLGIFKRAVVEPSPLGTMDEQGAGVPDTVLITLLSLGAVMAFDSEKELNDLRIAYADALWTWADIESQLFMIFYLAVKSRRSTKADMERLREMFFSINSFDIRLIMTHAAAKVKWD